MEHLHYQPVHVLIIFHFLRRVKDEKISFIEKSSVSSGQVPSVPFGVMELLLMCELSRFGPFGDSLLPLTRLCGLARSCISIDLGMKRTVSIVTHNIENRNFTLNNSVHRRHS